MMQRRLNKKVALIGSGVFILFLLAAIAVVFQIGKDPQGLIVEAEAALQAARKATDEQVKQELYKRARYAFGSAYDRTRDDTLRIELLFKMADMYLETGEWKFVLGCWDQIIRLNPSNAKARYGCLKYLYIIADNGEPQLWQQVNEWATQFLEKVDGKVLTEDTAKYDIPQLRPHKDGTQRLDAFLYLVRGRATLEMARLGMVTNKDESLAQAIADLKKLQELDPNNILSHLNLARAVVTKGEIFASRGDFQERDKATQEAIALLEQATEMADADPRAHIDLLALKRSLTGADGFAQHRERIRLLEPEYLSVAEQFSTHAEAFAALSSFYTEYSTYSGPELRSGTLKKAIEAAEKAMELDQENVMYALNVARLHFRLFSIYDDPTEVGKAIEIANSALSLRGAQDTTGPWQRVYQNNRYGLYALLARCYIEQILEERDSVSSSQVSHWLAGAEKAVHEIEQIFDSSQEPLAYKWRGMLELAKGNEDAAVRSLYQAYEQFRSVMPPEPPWPRNTEFAHLSYTLAKIFKDTTETGAVHDFLIRAIYLGIGEVQPEAYLDYVDVLLELNHWSDALQHISAFEEYFGANRRSQTLRVKVYIGARQFANAEEELTKMPVDEVDAMRLRLTLTQERIRHIRLAAQQTGAEGKPSSTHQNDAVQSITDELRNYRNYEAELLEQLVTIDPNSADEASFISVCRNYIAQGQTDQAKRLVDRFSQAFPDSATVLVYNQILSEPDPLKVTPQRLKEIEEQALSRATDPMLRALKLGIFYRTYNELEKAASQFKTAFDMAMSKERIPEGPVFERTKLAANHYLDMAIGKQDWVLAEEVVKASRTKNLDGCQGQVFATRLALAKGEYKDALVRANDCLKQKPVFSHGYMLRSHIHTALGNDHAAMEDIRRAASMNPLDGTITRVLASALYQRNQKLGRNVSDVQVTETKDALLKAIAFNPGDLGLRNLYADYIAPIEPLKAVAIRQDLLQADPSLENILLLGKLATEVAVKQNDPQTRQAMFDIAGSAFEQAKQTAPNDKRMLYYYAEYFRASGRESQAKALLQESDDQTLLWNHYLQAGQYEDAGKVLGQLYEGGTRDGSVLRGLLYIAEKTADIEGVKQYAEELVKSEDTLENNLSQIQAFLRVGLIKEAEFKLQSFKEKYPNEPRSLLLQASLAMRQNKLDEALDLTNRILQNDPENPTTWRLRGEVNFYREEYDKAISDLKKSKMLSDMSETRIILAKTYIQMERFEDAITELRNAIEAPGASVEARFLLEHIYLQLDRNSELKRLYEDTLEKFPHNPYWLHQAGTLALRTGEYGKAVDYIDTCIRNTEPTDPRRVDYIVKKGEILAEVYEKTSDKNYLKAAIAEYESLLDKMPNNTRVVTVLNNLAFLLAENEERLSDALGYAKRALDLEPKSPGILDTYAYVLLKSGNVSDAARFLTEALQRFEQDQIPVPAEVYEHKGMIKEQLGEKQEALAAYEEALNVGEKNLSEKAKQRIERAVARISP